MTSTRIALALAATLLVPSNAAVGQSIDLVCGGTMTQFEPSRTEGNVTQAATTIDLDSKVISTPVGTFRVTSVEDTKIYFDDPRSALKVFGQLDRMTGQMTVFWRRPEEEAKMKARLESKTAMHAELRCTAGKLLF